MAALVRLAACGPEVGVRQGKRNVTHVIFSASGKRNVMHVIFSSLPKTQRNARHFFQPPENVT